MEQDWKYDFTGRTTPTMVRQTQNGKVKITFDIDEQISEAENTCPAQRHVVVFGHRTGTNNKYMLKIRYDLNPDHFHIDDKEEWRKACDNHYLVELDVGKAAYDAGHGPRLIDWGTTKQGPGMPYPNGLMDIYITTLPPGEILWRIYRTLDDEDLRIIRRQLAFLLEAMRLKGFILHNQHSNYLTYDKENKKVYLFDFTFYDWLDGGEKTSPITEKSSFVLAFGVWPSRLLRESTPVIFGPPLSGHVASTSTQE